MKNMMPLPKPRTRCLVRVAGLVAVLLFLGRGTPLRADEPAGPVAKPLPAAAVEAIPVALDADARQKLLATGICTSYFREQPKVDLCPCPAAASDIRSTLAGVQPNLGIQTLAAQPMPAWLAARTDRDVTLYNLLQQFRSMEGIQYYSAGQGRMRLFCNASHLVKGPADRTALADPHYPAIEPAHEFYVEQDDSTFGRTLYAVTVKGLGGGAVELAMTNVEQVRYGLLPVLGPGALKLALVVQPSTDAGWLYFYGNVGVRTGRMFGMENRVRASFSNRLSALCTWFAKQAAGT